MTWPLNLLIIGDVADVSSLSDSSLGSLGSWSATGSLLLVSSATLLASLHVIGFLVSSEYPSGFVCNDGHLLQQYMILVHICQISPTALLVPRFLSVAPWYYLQVLMVQGTCSFHQNTSSELAVFLSALSELHVGRRPLALARYSWYEWCFLCNVPWATERGKAQLQELEYFLTPELPNSYLCYPRMLILICF